MRTIAARYITHDDEVQTASESLGINRRTAPRTPCHGGYRLCFTIVIQGSKSVQLGTNTINYGAGDYLLTSPDLPVALAGGSKEVLHFYIALAIDKIKLLDLIRLCCVSVDPPAELANA